MLLNLDNVSQIYISTYMDTRHAVYVRLVCGHLINLYRGSEEECKKIQDRYNLIWGSGAEGIDTDILIEEALK